MASEIQAYAPDARIMTTYYCGEYFPCNLGNYKENDIETKMISKHPYVNLSDHDIESLLENKQILEQTSINFNPAVPVNYSSKIKNNISLKHSMVHISTGQYFLIRCIYRRNIDISFVPIQIKTSHHAPILQLHVL